MTDLALPKAEDPAVRIARPAARDLLALALLSGVILVAFVLRLDQLDSRSLWVDEALSVLFSARPLPELLHLLVTEDIHPPLYPLLLHAWMAVAGTSEAAARFPSVVVGVLLVPLIYATGRRLELAAEPGVRLPVSLVGLVSAVIAATSAFYIGYSQEARNYMLVTFLGLLSSYLLLGALSQGGRRRWAAYALAGAAAVYTHYTAFLLLAFHLLFVAATWRSHRGAWRWWALSVLGIGAAYLPWLGYSVQQLERISDYWPGTLQLDAALRTSLLLFVAGGGVGPNGMMLPALLGIALLGVGLLALLLGASRTGPSHHILFLLFYLVVPSVLLLAVAYHRPKFDPRYLMVATPAFYLMLAWGIAAMLRTAVSRRVPLLLRAILPALGCAALAGTVAASALYGDVSQFLHAGDGNTEVQEYGDYRSLVAYLESRSEPGDAVAIMVNTYHPYVYYSKEQIPWYPMEPFDDFDGAIIRLNRMVEQGHRRIWFILWQTQWADPAGYVMNVMETQAREVPLDASFGDLGLRLFELKPESRFSFYPRVAHRPDAIFGDGMLMLWGWSSSATSVAGGDSIRFDLHWSPLSRAGGKLKTKVMLMDGELRPWAAVDEIMVSPFYPASQWKIDDILHDRHSLTVPAGTPPGEYDLMLLLYDELTMTDLPIARSSGEPLGTLLSLGKLAVTSTPESLHPPATRLPVATWQLGDDRLELLGFRVDPQSAGPGRVVDVELLWRAPRPVADSYSYRVALLDWKGELKLEQQLPLVLDYSTPRWRPGEPVISRHRFLVPDRLEPGWHALAVAVVGPQEKEVPLLRYTHLSGFHVEEPRQPGTPQPTPGWRTRIRGLLP